MKNKVKSSALASILIGLSVVALLSIDNMYIGAFLFSLGLISICYLNLDLFTGKCGFIYKTNPKDLFYILLINLIVGFLFGLIIHYSIPILTPLALKKISTWNFSYSFFMKSILCGMTMYLAVKLFKLKSNLGFCYVPFFILSGFQHCIANIVICGIAGQFSLTIIICILGNLVGSVIIDFLLN